MTKKKEFKLHQKSFDREGKQLSFETGKLAVQADSSITVKFCEDVLLISTVMEVNNPKTEADFLPLTLDFRDSYSAAWRIGGAVYRRREGRPTDTVTLYGRLADRALRPMFPKGMINDVVVSVTPLALDHEHPLGVMTIIGASVSIIAAGLPFEGPVGAAQIAYLDGKYIVNPTNAELAKAELNLLVSGKKWSINMIESEANEVPADILKKAFELWQKAIDQSCDMQADFLKKLTINKKEVVFNKPSEEVIAYLSNVFNQEKLSALAGNTKVWFNDIYSGFEKEAIELCKDKIADAEQADFTESKVKIATFNIVKHYIRERTLETGKRIDDRKEKDIRSLYCEVGMLPRVHGTGLFWRGDTQVLTTVTLWGPKDYLVLEDMENDNVKQRYFHHYNFPGFSVHEAKAMRGTGRREIWHGKLAEKALERMIPDKTVFPYSIRLVSECLGSGGSTSMGSVCGSTLSLMDAWVPIKKPVAGIAMGLMTEHDDKDKITKHMVLNDLMATEDFTGDMDFKVAGTVDGVTAIQLDTKLKGIPMDIVFETIDRSIEGYKEIMDFMLKTIDKPRDHIGTYAPKIFVMKVDPGKIKEVIGKWGDVINKIIDEHDKVKIDFEDDGTCYITHQNQEIIDQVVEIIKEIVTDLEIGQTFDARISRVEDYGLFVELPKKKMGLCHISNLGERFVTPLTNHFKIGQVIKVAIKGIDETGKIAVKKV